ncbi:MAG: YdcF family protein [Deltaproteobacteria bacterium]|nr:YdcF family protein [Deltaproteobacteria bacterium]
MSLELSWLCALELLRERAPGALRVVLAGPWTLAAAAWLHPEPEGRRWREALRLVGCSLVFEAALDGMLLYEPKVCLPRWQVARGGALLAASALSGRLPGPGSASLARALTLVPVGLYLGCLGRVLRGAAVEDTRAADAAVVLGFALGPGGRALPSLVARVRHGAALWHRGLVRYVVLTGGPARPGEPTEASVAWRLAREAGVPESALLMEERSLSTGENFLEAMKVLEARGLRSALVVTEAFHLTRALDHARRVGLRAYGSPAPSEAWSDPRRALWWLHREALALTAEDLLRWALGAG